jgi:hypothetical protein
MKEECDMDRRIDCSWGLHIQSLTKAIKFASSRMDDFKILECAVPLNKMVIPTVSLPDGGKVRTSELTVLREVPKEEWGPVYK